MKIDIRFLTEAYFAFDEPVPYKIGDETVKIYPITLKDVNLFTASVDILTVDKNSWSDPKVISMNYLQFLCEVLIPAKEANIWRLGNILSLCLGMKRGKLCQDNDPKHKPFIFDEETGVKIYAKDFDNIKDIILHQNFPNYDDSYINPELKEAMAEQDRVKNKGIEAPNLERRIAIISAHSGITKAEQLSMTMRSHNMLFSEVVGEIEFTSTRTGLMISRMLGDKSPPPEHWIYPKQKGKFDGYIKSVQDYKKSAGMDSGAIKTS